MKTYKYCVVKKMYKNIAVEALDEADAYNKAWEWVNENAYVIGENDIDADMEVDIYLENKGE